MVSAKGMETYKVIIVGDTSTGKTSMLNQYVFGKFTISVPCTIGVEFTHKELDDETKIVFWDTAGQERYQSLRSAYYRGAQAIMFVYDVTHRDSFLSLNQWWREFRSFGNTKTCTGMLVGNKIDLDGRVVSKEEATAWAVRYGFTYGEISSKDATNLKTVFNQLIQQLKKLPSVQKDKLHFHSKPKTDRCCY